MKYTSMFQFRISKATSTFKHPSLHRDLGIGVWTRIQTFGLALGICALVGFGCKKSGSQSPSDTSAPQQKQFTIGMSQCNSGEPWRVQMNADIETAAKKHPE